MFGLLPPGNQVPYHYHQKRESVIVVISGEAIEVIEGEETLIKKGDILFIPSGKKHMTINRSDQEFRYLEFYTCPPLSADFIDVEQNGRKTIEPDSLWSSYKGLFQICFE